MKPKIQAGLDLYRLYAAEGRQLPASWIARSVGVSPTTMTKYLSIYCPDYAPRKGWSPGRGWNWSRTKLCTSIRRMSDQEIIWSNGKPWEVGPELDKVEVDKLVESDDAMSFEDAMGLVEEGMAVLRTENCKRVIFRGEGDSPLVGTTTDESICTALGPYVPTFEDIKALDWCIDAHLGPPKLQAV